MPAHSSRKETAAPTRASQDALPARGPPRGATDFPVVAIGASAGGLDACRKFLAALPADNGMAFILIQHLDPTHESMMVDLLAAHTSMTVRQATDGMRIEPDHLYVIPPGTYLSVADGALHLSQPAGPSRCSPAVRLLAALAGRGLRHARHLRDPFRDRVPTAASVSKR